MLCAQNKMNVNFTHSTFHVRKRPFQRYITCLYEAICMTFTAQKLRRQENRFRIDNRIANTHRLSILIFKPIPNTNPDYILSLSEYLGTPWGKCIAMTETKQRQQQQLRMSEMQRIGPILIKMQLDVGNEPYLSRQKFPAFVYMPYFLLQASGVLA